MVLRGSVAPGLSISKLFLRVRKKTLARVSVLVNSQLTEMFGGWTSSHSETKNLSTKGRIMRIRIDFSEKTTQPSQGRNRGSIPRGSASEDSPYYELPIDGRGVAHRVVVGDFYRVELLPGTDGMEFVRFVGIDKAFETLCFEDVYGDIHPFMVDQVECV